jgi:vancomycin resistance protein VanW
MKFMNSVFDQLPFQKPINRSNLRLFAGNRYYTLKRYGFWLFGGLKFAGQTKTELPYEMFSHKTPLLRRLKDVDMYLQRNKIVNLKIAVPRVHGVTIFPGETFSYWKLIGKPTKRKGYLDGMVLRNGNAVPGTGGGLCQLSNLIYWMTIHTPLTVAERRRHSYDVFPDADRTQPFGSGATCFYNYGDLMIRNDTAQTYRLVLKVTEDELRGAWTSDEFPALTYEVYEKEHFFRPEFWGGYTRHNLLFRRVFAKGEYAGEEYVAENHAFMMYEPLLPGF